jgi:hypothetical protein
VYSYTLKNRIYRNLMIFLYFYFSHIWGLRIDSLKNLFFFPLVFLFLFLGNFSLVRKRLPSINSRWGGEFGGWQWAFKVCSINRCVYWCNPRTHVKLVCGSICCLTLSIWTSFFIFLIFFIYNFFNIIF